MSNTVSKVLILRVEGADEKFETELVAGIDSSGGTREILDLEGADYGAVLERLGPGVLPVVLRPPMVS